MEQLLPFVLAAVLGFLALGAILNFNQYCGKQYGHRFFTLRRVVLGCLASASAFGGWMLLRAESGDYSTVGLLLMAAGIACLAGMVAYNIIRTNPLIGVAGSAMEIAVFTAGGLFGIAAALPAALLLVASLFSPPAPKVYPGHPEYDYYKT